LVLGTLLGLASTEASAQITRRKVLLRCLMRDLEITLAEPGLRDTLVLDGDEFVIDGLDSSGGFTATREIVGSNPPRVETATILKDAMILGAFKRSPYWSAMSMAFINANEVSCPSSTEAVLLVTLAQKPQKIVGNCIHSNPGSQ